MFDSLMQDRPSFAIVVCQCLMSPQASYQPMNSDLKKKFEVQPMNRNNLPNGDMLQIAVPNESSQEQYLILI